ncbi:T-complex protein 1 subunit beta [Acarospora aff. strigata]|nr:T-complex protein 1 subunit beta [Acarospora aff. strigata]
MNASYKLVDVELSVQAYRLHGKESLKQTGYLGDVKAEKDDVTEEAWLAGAKVTTLPDKDLDGLWDSLIFEESIPARLLRFVTRMMLLSTSKLDDRIIAWNRLILLYGPPGTGKTSLCRALAQQLSIRLGQHYPESKLIEVNSHSLFSKYFSESGKLVGKLFEDIESMLDEVDDTFVVVLIDEVESLTSAREQAALGIEPNDAMRAVNALLTALDRLKHRVNVLVLCTSNLIVAMDSAFMDRVDVKQYVPNPSAKAGYEILRTCYCELVRCGIVANVGASEVTGTIQESTQQSQWQIVDTIALPQYPDLLLDYWLHPASAPKRLWSIAERSVGLSARTLRRLPALALALYTDRDPCSMDEALTALSQAVDDEFAVKKAAFNPTQIFGDDVTEEKGENARLSAFVGAIAVGDLVKSTLGPKGMDKILQSASTGEIMVTNDGATILKAIALDNAAAKVLVNISKVQDDEVGDGTTSVTVLAAELLREAEKLVEKKIHPQTIIEGYRIASHAALSALEKSAVDHSKDKSAFRQDLLSIARTTLSSKVLSQDRTHFAELACDAVLRMQGSTDLSHIQIIKKAGGKLNDSYLDEGFILDKSIGVNQPKRLENAKILVANTSMDTDKIKIFGARVKVESTGKLAELEKAEREKMKAKVEKIKAHGINCFVNRQLIYNWPEQLFSDAGIVSIEHADFDGIERLALVTGGEIASTFDHPESVKLGHCDLIEEVIIGEDTLIKFSGVAAGQACTIVLRGATEQLLDEAERSLHDALAVLSQTVREPKTTLGGGCAEMVMAKAVDQAAQKVAGKKAIAVDSFAKALRQLPTILADNAGLDSSDLVTRLRSEIYNGMMNSGLDLLTPGGGIADMRDLGVIESYKLKRAVVSSASEAAELLLRVDSIIRSAPRKRERM